MKITPTLLIIACALSLVAGIGGTWWMLAEGSGHRGGHLDGIPPELRFGDSFMDEFFDDRFFDRSRDPFTEMDRMQKRLEEELYHFRGEELGLPDSSWFEGRFDEWFRNRFGDRDAGAISMHEDDEFIYYELELGEEVNGDVNVTVDDDYITVTAQTQSGSSKQESGSSYTTRSLSSLNQRFPLPANGDPNSVEIDHEGSTVTIRIGKLT